MENPDTGFAGKAGSDIDPLLDPFAGFEDAEAAERQEGFEPVPRHDNYHVKITGTKGSLSSNKGTPQLFVMAEIVDGVEDTAGKRVGGNLFLSVSPTRDVKPEVYNKMVRDAELEGKPVPEMIAETEWGKITIKRTPEEFAKARTVFQETLMRIAEQLRLPSPRPDAPVDNEANLDAYGAQMVDKECIIALSQRKFAGEVRNDFVWRSIAALDAPVIDKNTKKPTGKTAKDQSREKIKEYDTKKKGGTRGRTAASFRSPSAGGFGGPA